MRRVLENLLRPSIVVSGSKRTPHWCCPRPKLTRPQRHPCGTTAAPSTSNANGDNLRLHTLDKIYSDIADGRLGKDPSYIETVTGEVTSILSQPSLDRNTVQAVTKVVRLFGTRAFLEHMQSQIKFFDSVSEVLVSVKHDVVWRHLLPSFLWSCSKVRYYNSSLMSHVGEFVLDFLPRFSFWELNMVVYTYACLNHHLPELVSGLQRLLLNTRAYLQPFTQYLVWTLVWAAMVFRDYPKDLLTHILTDKYIQGI